MSAVIWGNFRRFLFWFSLLWLMADSSKTRFQNPLPHECSFYQAVSQSFNSSKFHFPQLWTESCQNSFGDESGRIRLLVVMTLTDSPFDRPLDPSFAINQTFGQLVDLLSSTDFSPSNVNILPKEQASYFAPVTNSALKLSVDWSPLPIVIQTVEIIWPINNIKHPLTNLLSHESVIHVEPAVLFGFDLSSIGTELNEGTGKDHLTWDFVPNEHDTQFHVERVGNGAWHLDQLDSKEFIEDGYYNYRASGRGVNVHILDTGVNLNSTNYEYLYKDTCPANTDCHGHGTHVAGIVGGRLFGVAKQARLLSSPVLSATGVGSNDVIVRALANIASRGTKDGTAVINMSLGGPVSTLLDSIISAKIADHGFIVVVAAGNDNDDACRYSPARNPNVITIGSHGITGKRSGFSNFGPCVDFYAPGETIRSAYKTHKKSYHVLQGTSMATPIVAGMVAQLLEENPDLTTAQVKSILRSGIKERPIYNSSDNGFAVSINMRASPCSLDGETMCSVHSITLPNTSCKIHPVPVFANTFPPVATQTFEMPRCIIELGKNHSLWSLDPFLTPTLNVTYQFWLQPPSAGKLHLKSCNRTIASSGQSLKVDLSANVRYDMIIETHEPSVTEVQLFIERPFDCLSVESACEPSGKCMRDGRCQCVDGRRGARCQRKPEAQVWTMWEPIFPEWIRKRRSFGYDRIFAVESQFDRPALSEMVTEWQVSTEQCFECAALSTVLVMALLLIASCLVRRFCLRKDFIFHQPDILPLE